MLHHPTLFFLQLFYFPQLRTNFHFFPLLIEKGPKVLFRRGEQVAQKVPGYVVSVELSGLQGGKSWNGNKNLTT